MRRTLERDAAGEMQRPRPWPRSRPRPRPSVASAFLLPMVTIEPPSFCASITLNASRVTRNTPLARTALFFSQSARLVSAKLAAVASPAFGDDDVDAAEPLDRAGRAARAPPPRRSRRPRTACTTSRPKLPAKPVPASSSASASMSVSTTQAPSASSRARHRTADAAGPAGDQRDPARQRLGLGHALQLRLLEQPVLDVERLLLGQADIGVDAGSTAHDVDRVDVELGRDPGRGLVAGEGQHADARAPGRPRRWGRAWPGCRHAGSARSSRHSPGGSARPAGRAPASSASAGTTSGRILVRRKWSGQEVPSAASSSSRCELTNSSTAGDVVDMADLGLAGRDPAAQPRQQAAHDAAAARPRGSASTRGPPNAAGAVVGIQPVLRPLDDAAAWSRSRPCRPRPR